MADYTFYIDAYQGDSIPEQDFPRLIKRAGDVLTRYKRIYRVTAPEKDSDDMAVCAIADALFYFETAQSTPQSNSIGSVSESRGTVDVSPRAQARELLRSASLYLDIYRGAGAC